MTDTTDNDPDAAGRAAERASVRAEPAPPPSTSVDPASAEPSSTGPATIDIPTEGEAAAAEAAAASAAAATTSAASAEAPPTPYRPESAPTHPTAAVPEATAAYPPASVPQRRRPLLATILWGVVLLAFAAFMLITILVPGPDATLWLLGGVAAIGLLLVVIGIMAAARRAG